ncbi:Maf family protein [Entomobacter blattae]|nr:Maf family nucleotide pyrophosphatase [Entomobacter blattae]
MLQRKKAFFVLASSSPRRLELLAQIGLTPDLLLSPNIDEALHPHELPRVYCQRVAHLKALACLSQAAGQAPPESLLLAADTVICTARRLFPKTEDPQQARSYLEYLSGRRHRAITTVALYKFLPAHSSSVPPKALASRTVQTVVSFNRLSKTQIAHYLSTEEWKNKAGGYAIQGYAASFVKFISGSYSNVVGLPLFETAQLFRGQGWLP